MGVSIGFFSVAGEIGDVDPIAKRIREIVGPVSIGFPFACSPVKCDVEEATIYYAVINGHVPIHIDPPDANERQQSLFMFVIQALNRPVLLTSPALKEVSEVILVPDTVHAPRTAFGAIELNAGKAIHIDITRQWHGITGFPTGDPVAALPEAVIVQVPWADAHDIRGAIGRMKRIMCRDDRFADLVTRKQA